MEYIVKYVDAIIKPVSIDIFWNLTSVAPQGS